MYNVKNDTADLSLSSKAVVQKRGFVKYNTVHKQQKPKTKTTSLLLKATKHYLNIIQHIDPAFEPDQLYIPKRTLTNPREPSKNFGYDNINDDYILVVHDIIANRYKILDLMGQGTFGQVVMCEEMDTGQRVAVKVIKQQEYFSIQGKKELRILEMLKQRPEHKDRFLQLKNKFNFRGHTCAVFELLSISLHKLFISQQQQAEIGRPNIEIQDIRKISFHLLETLALLKDMGIIHTDLKPDNILLKNFDVIGDVKLIDYGSALLEKEELNYHIQNPFYRSPEVLLRVKFDCAIDMWSFGCLVAELYLGQPLFPSEDELALIHRMCAVLNSLPPNHMLMNAKKTNLFFEMVRDPNGNTSTPKLRNMEPNRTHDPRIILEEKIMGFNNDDDDNYEAMQGKKNLLDFLKKILVFDPAIRMTPREALNHEFITGNKTAMISPAIVYDSLVNATNNSISNITSSTEESQEIKTPVISPPQKLPRPILKKTNTDFQRYSTLPENMLDTKRTTFLNRMTVSRSSDSTTNSSVLSAGEQLVKKITKLNTNNNSVVSPIYALQNPVTATTTTNTGPSPLYQPTSTGPSPLYQPVTTSMGPSPLYQLPTSAAAIAVVQQQHPNGHSPLYSTALGPSPLYPQYNLYQHQQQLGNLINQFKPLTTSPLYHYQPQVAYNRSYYQ